MKYPVEAVDHEPVAGPNVTEEAVVFWPLTASPIVIVVPLVAEIAEFRTIWLEPGRAVMTYAVELM